MFFFKELPFNGIISIRLSFSFPGTIFLISFSLLIPPNNIFLLSFVVYTAVQNSAPLVAWFRGHHREAAEPQGVCKAGYFVMRQQMTIRSSCKQ